MPEEPNTFHPLDAPEHLRQPNDRHGGRLMAMINRYPGERQYDGKIPIHVWEAMPETVATDSEDEPVNVGYDTGTVEGENT